MEDCSSFESDGAMTLQGFECIFGNLVGALLGLAGIIFFMMFIVGGFKYITSAGNPKNAESANKTLTYAVMGLVFVAVSFLILVIIDTITGPEVNVTNFRVFIPFVP